jgi:hypothetical protein
MSSPDASGIRHEFLRAMLGEPPSPDAVLRVATNHAPAEGVGRGIWTETVARSIDHAVEIVSRDASRGDVYVAPAWFTPSLPKVKAGVIAKEWVTVEIDFKSMPGTTPEERRQQATTLAGCLPCPTIVIASGGGFHLHVRLPEQFRVQDFVDAADGVERVEGIARALRIYVEQASLELVGKRVALDHVHGAERVWRVPPSWNAKAADGRRELTSDQSTWREVTLFRPGRADALSSIAAADLSFLAPVMQAAEDEQTAARRSESDVAATLDGVTPCRDSSQSNERRHVPGSSGVSFAPSLLSGRLHKKWPLDEGDQSDRDFEVASKLAEDGWSPRVAVEAIRLRRSLLRDAGNREKGLRDDYVRTTVLKAYARAARPTPPPATAPFTPLPIDVLPAPIRDFVAKGKTAMTCAAEAIVLPLLAALGAAIGNTRRVRLKRTWTEPALLWVCVILSSGKTKSPAQELALRPHVARQKRAFAQYRAAMRRYAAAYAAHKRELKDWEKNDKGGDLPEPPVKPFLVRVVVSEATIEAITPILEENPRGLLMTRDELSGWMKSFDAYRNGRGADREHWLSAHRAHPIIVDRKTEREVRFVERGFIAVCGGTQPGILRRLFTPEFFESGMVARLLLAWPDSPAKRWTDADIPLNLQQAVERVFERLLSLEMEREIEGLGIEEPASPRAPEPVLLPLSAQAHDLWRAFYNEFAVEQEGLDDEDSLGAAFAKLEAYAARFALILELVEWAGSDRKEPPTEISTTSMSAGITLARWFAAEQKRIYQRLEEDGNEQRRRRLVAWIFAQGRPVTALDVVRGLRMYRSAPDAAHADVEDLVKTGIAWRLSIPPPPKGGHATTAYELRAQVSSLERGDARPKKPSADKDLRDRASPPEPDAGPCGVTS